VRPAVPWPRRLRGAGLAERMLRASCVVRGLRPAVPAPPFCACIFYRFQV